MELIVEGGFDRGSLYRFIGKGVFELCEDPLFSGDCGVDVPKYPKEVYSPLEGGSWFLSLDAV